MYSDNVMACYQRRSNRLRKRCFGLVEVENSSMIIVQYRDRCNGRLAQFDSVTCNNIIALNCVLFIAVSAWIDDPDMQRGLFEIQLNET